MTNIKEKYGIVVLLDALGIQNASIEESLRFVKFIEESSRTALAYLDVYSAHREDRLSEHHQEFKPITRTFGDTFLLTWESSENSILLNQLQAVSRSVGSLISDGVQNGILFRGAISIGKYLESEFTVIGPAITDAASWHEQADWFGCITTPSCNYKITSKYPNTEYAFPGIVKYNVPFKSRSPINLWCVNWVDILRDEESEAMEYFYSCISELNIPIKTEDKYRNIGDVCSACAISSMI